MTSNSLERKTFNKHKKALISELGSKALDDKTLNTVGKREFAAWGGVFPSDRGTLQPFHYYIYYTDKHDKPGTHWIAVYCSKGRAYVYDSYARPISSIAYQLIKSIKKRCLKLGKTDEVHRMEQVGYTSKLCGINCLSFLMTVRDLGIALGNNI